MSVSEVASPFAAADLHSSPDAADPWVPRTGAALLTPFAESMTADTQDEFDAGMADALLAELDDEAFEDALQALADEVAGRHLRSAGTWSPESTAPALDAAEAEQWMDSLAAESDRILGRLEAHFADRPIESLRDGEVEAAAGLDALHGDPHGAQEQFLKSLVSKVKKAAQGVGKLAQKGLRAAGKLLPLGALFGLLRKLVRPLLQRVLQQAIGRLPAPLRPLATSLAARFAGQGEVPADDEAAPDDNLAEAFDRQVTELVLAPNDAAVERLLAEAEPPPDTASRAEPLHDLDAARAQLARELVEADPGQPPTAQLERFIPAVMAAMPLIRTGIRIVGRERVVSFLAGALAKLIQGMVGAQAARLLSRHIASTGLGLLGLEAENGAAPALGTEALVASAEDAVREVLSLPPGLLRHELLLEAEVQDAFAEAAARHLPAAVLRPEVVEGESEAEHAVWVMMPRATRPCYRFKKYSRVIPVRIGRPVARSVVMSGGDTLEQRLLDAGARSWPVTGEMEIYELLEGAELGHVAAFEAADVENIAEAALEFEELTASAATALAGNPRLAATGRHARSRRGGRRGARYYRLRVGGRPLRRRSRFGLRLDLTSAQPILSVHLRVGERDAHALAGHLDQGRLVQVVSTVRGLVGPAAQQRLGQRLERMLGRHGVRLTPGAGLRLAGQLADGLVGAVSNQLPAAAATLARAARDPAAGVTLTFGFTFPDKGAVGTAPPAGPTLAIRAGHPRD